MVLAFAGDSTITKFLLIYNTIISKNGCKYTIIFPNMQILGDFFILFVEKMELCNICCNFCVAAGILSEQKHMNNYFQQLFAIFKKFLYLCSVQTSIDHIVRRLLPCYPPHEARELAYWIVEETTGLNRFDIRTHKGEMDIPDLDEIIGKLLNHVPVQYIFGHTQWMGMQLRVSPATLIPRPETAELVEAVSSRRSTASVLDIGTGSGCIALALKQRHPEWTVHGLDKSREALEVAKLNAKNLGLDVHFFTTDILQDEIGEYDIIVSNPPYVRPSERSTMTENTLLHEPHDALFVPEDDPLLFYRRIAALHKAPELWFEINENMGSRMLALMQQSGYKAECLNDIYGKQRFIHATRLPA